MYYCDHMQVLPFQILCYYQVFSFPAVRKKFSGIQMNQTSLRPTRLPVQPVPMNLSPRINPTGLESDHSSCAYRGDVRNEQSYAPAPNMALWDSTGLFVSPSGISELDCVTTKTDTAEKEHINR